MSYQYHIFGRAEPTLVYDHPPFELLLFWPLAYLSYPVAYVLWDLLNVALLAWSLYLLKPYTARCGTDARLLLTISTIYPLISTLREGQDSILLLLAYSVAFLSLKRDNQFAAGCALGAGLFKFQLVLPLLLVFLVRKRWRIVLAALSAGTGLGLLSLALVGRKGIHSYVELLLTVTQHGRHYVPTIGMPNVRGFVETVFANRVSHQHLSFLVAVVSVGLLGWTIRQWGNVSWEPRKKTYDLVFSLSLLVSLLVAYHSFMHNLIVLVLPTALLLDYCAASGRGAFRRWRPILPLIVLFLVTVFLNVEGGNMFSFLFVPLLWFAFAISEEIPLSREWASAQLAIAGAPPRPVAVAGAHRGGENRL
jgi:hypothetical protein